MHVGGTHLAVTDLPSDATAEEKAIVSATPDDVLASFDAEDLLTTATIYWTTQTIGPFDASVSRGAPRPVTPAQVQVPLAINQPAAEEYSTPESWWRRLQPIHRYTALPGAGHFPEWERPQDLADDLISFVNSIA